ncbi:hypothetical protein G6F43_007947 [Rhizopus delemar]|nr:hypothetical protein G6F43_007947 [Rhizopus delemar]
MTPSSKIWHRNKTSINKKSNYRNKKHFLKSNKKHSKLKKHASYKGRLHRSSASFYSHKRPTRSSSFTAHISSSASLNSLPIVTSSSSSKYDPTDAASSNSKNEDDQNSNSYLDTNSIVAASRLDPNIEQSNITTSNPLPTRSTQTIILTIGLFGGIAFIAAAMFLIVRKRKRNNKQSHNEIKEKEEKGITKCIPQLTIASTKAATEKVAGMNEKKYLSNAKSKIYSNSTIVTDLSSTADTLVDGSSGQQKYDNQSQRSSWQTFITCETAKTEDMHTRIPIYKAQLADPLVAYDS